MTTKLTERQRISAAMIDILRDSPFYAHVLLALQFKVDTTIRTASTDGVHLKYNPEYIATLTRNGLNWLLRHEALHVILGHHIRLAPMIDDIAKLKAWRGASRNDLWTALNIGADAAVNYTLRSSVGADEHGDAYLPGVGTFADAPSNQTAEFYIDWYAAQRDAPDDSDSDDSDDSGADDSSSDDSSESGTESADDVDGDQSASDQTDSSEDADGAAAQSEDGSDGEDDSAIEYDGQAGDFEPHPLPDEMSQLARELVQVVKGGRDWSRPNRRQKAYGSVLRPANAKRSLGHIVFVVDTSGSMRSDEMNVGLFAAQDAVSQLGEFEITLLHSDTKVHEQHYNKWDLPIDTTSWSWKGRGGTRFEPALERAKELKPRAVIFITDGEVGNNWGEPIGIPIIWLVTRDNKEATHGTTIRVQA
jgi:predicted metal-dependent peptidase